MYFLFRFVKSVFPPKNHQFFYVFLLCVITKLRKATFSFIISDCLSARINWAHKNGISLNLIFQYFRKSVEKSLVIKI
jgi:hypothetical protein